MAWLNNPYRKAKFEKYELTQAECDTLFGYCRMPKASNKEVHDLCVEFWNKLAEKHGFDPWSVSCVNRRSLTFEAEPV